MSTEEAYEKLKEECERRGYDYAIMCRLAVRLSEMRGTAIPRGEKKPKCKGKKKPKDARRRLVLCVETGKVFNSIKEAARAVFVAPCTISAAARGEKKTSAGYHWQYIDKKAKK